MTKARDTFGYFTINTTGTRRSAEAKVFRRAVILTIIAATGFAGAALASASQSAAADRVLPEGSYQVAYANFDTGRFGGFADAVAPQDDLHELNDAWMGMPVISADGVRLGFISDAFVNEDGSVDELVIEPEGDSPLWAPVYLPARYAGLQADAVTLSIGATQSVALLAPAGDLDRMVD